MLKIGDFSRISQVSIKSLRHYDAIGLFRPCRIDPENGYRYYSVEQLVEVNHILALRDLGFSLEETAQLLRTYDRSQLLALLQTRLTEQQRCVAVERARQERLAERIRHLQELADSKATFDYHIILKVSEPLTLVGMRRVVPTVADIGAFAEEVAQRFASLGLMPAGPSVHVYDDTGDNSADEGGEEQGIPLLIGAPMLAWPGSADAAQPNDLERVQLPGGERMATVIHRGPYTTINAAYVALGRWLAANGYRQRGPSREVNYYSPCHSPDSSTYITELQFPVVTCTKGATDDPDDPYNQAG